VLNLITDSEREYQDASNKFRDSVAKFNQSLLDAALEAGIGRPLLLIH
jgi:hypothetical protein